jgi:hypothetical protein
MSVLNTQHAAPVWISHQVRLLVDELTVDGAILTLSMPLVVLASDVLISVTNLGVVSMNTTPISVALAGLATSQRVNV